MVTFGMVGKMTTDPADREKLVSILTQAVELIRVAPGCYSYIVSKDANDDGTVWVMELWESKEAHDQSLTDPAVRELIGLAMPLLKGQPDGASLIPVVGKGL